MGIFTPAVQALAALYQSTVTEVSAGNLGQARMTARRALLTAADVNTFVAWNDGGSGGANNGNHAALGASSTYTFQLPLEAVYARSVGIAVRNTLNQSVTFRITAQYSGGASAIVLAASVAAGASLIVLSDAAGTGAGSNIEVVPALKGVLGIAPFLSVVTGTDPTSGYIEVQGMWRS